MNSYATFQPASIRRRGLAAVINFVALSVVLGTLGSAKIDDFVSVFLVQLVVAVLFSHKSLNPGNRLLGLIVLDEDKSPSSFRRKLMRNLPILSFFGFILASSAVLELKDLQIPDIFTGSFRSGVGFLLLFLISNYSYTIIDSEDKTFMDRRLNMRVYSDAYPGGIKR